MNKRELEFFYNEGFGWICKNCETKTENTINEKARLMTEGEAESKQPVFSNRAMARWIDSKKQTLICPSCENTESINK